MDEDEVYRAVSAASHEWADGIYTEAAGDSLESRAAAAHGFRAGVRRAPGLLSDAALIEEVARRGLTVGGAPRIDRCSYCGGEGRLVTPRVEANGVPTMVCSGCAKDDPPTGLSVTAADVEDAFSKTRLDLDDATEILAELGIEVTP